MSKLLQLKRAEVGEDLIKFIQRVQRAKVKHNAKLKTLMFPENEKPFPNLTFYPSEVHDAAKIVYELSMYNNYMIPPDILFPKFDRMGYIPDIEFLFELHQEIWVDLYTAMGMPADGAEHLEVAKPSTAPIKMTDMRHPDYRRWKTMMECEKLVIEITD